jgi:hypothetical protein
MTGELLRVSRNVEASDRKELFLVELLCSVHRLVQVSSGNTQGCESYEAPDPHAPRCLRGSAQPGLKEATIYTLAADIEPLIM